MKAVLGLDWGQKNIGIATADAAGIAITPHPVYVRKNRPEKSEIWTLDKSIEAHLKKFIEDFSCEIVVLGKPQGLQGQDTEGSQGALALKAELETKLKVQVVLINESLTSWELDQRKNEFKGAQKSFFKENKDSF